MTWNMETIYLGCAAIGGTVLVVQTVLLLFGGGDHDADVMHVDEVITHLDGLAVKKAS